MGTPNTIAKWLFLAVCAAFFVCLCSCRTTRVTTRQIEEKPVVMQRTTHDSISTARVQLLRDTILMRDSIIVRADGVDRWHTRYVTRDRYKHDTVTIVKTDSVPRPVLVQQKITKEVSEPPNVWRRVGNSALWFFLGMVAFAVVYAVAAFKAIQ